MKKSSFVALVLGTVSLVLFALGMCMALIPEWNAFHSGMRAIHIPRAKRTKLTVPRTSATKLLFFICKPPQH